MSCSRRLQLRDVSARVKESHHVVPDGLCVVVLMVPGREVVDFDGRV